MNAVCVKCKKEMKCEKMGVTVAPENIPTHTRSGDKYKCPICKTEIVIGFGDAYMAHNNADILIREK